MKKDYQKSIDALRIILNEIDPEGLEPGQEDGSPTNEYDDEGTRIYIYITHNLESIKLNKNLLVVAINKVWLEKFGNECKDANEIASRIIKVLF